MNKENFFKNTSSKIFFFIFLVVLFILTGRNNGFVDITSKYKLNENNMYAEDYFKFVEDTAKKLNNEDLLSLKVVTNREEENNIILYYTFKNSNYVKNEYNNIMSSTIHTTYNSIKNNYIVKKYVQESKDIYIEFKFLDTNGNYIGGTKIKYMHFFDRKVWPEITDTNFLKRK